MSCYTGPLGTEGQGICQSGTKTCGADGSFGACEGEVKPQEESCATPIDEDCDGLAPPCKGDVLWAKRFGGPGLESPGAQVAVDSAGSIILTGAFQGTVDFGGGPVVSAGANDVFVVKLDASGGHLWSTRFGDAEDQLGGAVAVDQAGNIVLIGSFHGAIDFGGGNLDSGGQRRVYVAKLDGAGNHLWSKRLGGTGSQDASSVSVGAGNEILVAGAFGETVDFDGAVLTSAGGADLFLAKLDPGGASLWARRFGDAADQFQDSIRVASLPTGGAAITGYFGGSLDLGGGPLVSAGGDDVFFCDLGSAGDHLWSRRAGGPDNQRASGIAIGPGGVRAIAGQLVGAAELGGGTVTSAGAEDALLVGLGADGANAWGRRFGDGDVQVALGAAIDGAGGLVLVGAFDGLIDLGGGPIASAGLLDAFVAKLDQTGAHLWSKRFGDAAAQTAIAAATDPQGNVIVLGTLWGTMDLGATVLTSAGFQDIFVAKLSP
ncbi:MAG: nucleotide-binding protein [Polyangiaceae bacterium]|nr:nucleotide-binding protein [Polyangiaceae bacterium]